MQAPNDSYAKPDRNFEWVDWIAKISQGDEAALCKLYHAAINPIYGLALRITRVPATAEEVVGEVFFQVWCTAGTFDVQRGSPLTWMLVICRSLAIAKLRSADSAVSFADVEADVEGIIDEAANPQSLLVAVETNALLHRALQTLHARDRQLLGLAFFRGLTYSEIAEQMAMPLGTVKTCMRRALQCLRKRLAILELGGRDGDS